MALNDDEAIVATPYDSGSTQNTFIKENTKLTIINKDKAPLEKSNITVFLELTDTGIDSERDGVDMVAVIDVSESMAGETWRRMKNTVNFMVEKLSTADRLSIVTSSKDGMRLSPLMQVTKISQVEIAKLVNALDTTPGTNIIAGLKVAVKVLQDRSHSTRRTAAIMLMSDGNQCKDIGDATDHDFNHIPIYTFGFGENCNQKVLKIIAEKSGGMFKNANDVENTPSNNLSIMLSNSFSKLLNESVSDLQLSFKQIDSTKIAKMNIGSYPVSYNNDIATIFLGNLYKQEIKNLSIDLLLPAVTENRLKEVLEISLSFIDRECLEHNSRALVSVTRKSQVVVPQDMYEESERGEIEVEEDNDTEVATNIPPSVQSLQNKFAGERSTLNVGKLLLGFKYFLIMLFLWLIYFGGFARFLIDFSHQRENLGLLLGVFGVFVFCNLGRFKSVYTLFWGKSSRMSIKPSTLKETEEEIIDERTKDESNCKPEKHNCLLLLLNLPKRLICFICNYMGKFWHVDDKLDHSIVSIQNKEMNKGKSSRISIEQSTLKDTEEEILDDRKRDDRNCKPEKHNILLLLLNLPKRLISSIWNYIGKFSHVDDNIERSIVRIQNKEMKEGKSSRMSIKPSTLKETEDEIIDERTKDESNCKPEKHNCLLLLLNLPKRLICFIRNYMGKFWHVDDNIDHSIVSIQNKEINKGKSSRISIEQSTLKDTEEEIPDGRIKDDRNCKTKKHNFLLLLMNLPKRLICSICNYMGKFSHVDDNLEHSIVDIQNKEMKQGKSSRISIEQSTLKDTEEEILDGRKKDDRNRKPEKHNFLLLLMNLPKRLICSICNYMVKLSHVDDNFESSIVDIQNKEMKEGKSTRMSIKPSTLKDTEEEIIDERKKLERNCKHEKHNFLLLLLNLPKRLICSICNYMGKFSHVNDNLEHSVVGIQKKEMKEGKSSKMSPSTLKDTEEEIIDDRKNDERKCRLEKHNFLLVLLNLPKILICSICYYMGKFWHVGDNSEHSIVDSQKKKMIKDNSPIMRGSNSSLELETFDNKNELRAKVKENSRMEVSDSTLAARTNENKEDLRSGDTIMENSKSLTPVCSDNGKKQSDIEEDEASNVGKESHISIGFVETSNAVKQSTSEIVNHEDDATYTEMQRINDTLSEEPKTNEKVDDSTASLIDKDMDTLYGDHSNNLTKDFDSVNVVLDVNTKMKEKLKHFEDAMEDGEFNAYLQAKQTYTIDNQAIPDIKEVEQENVRKQLPNEAVGHEDAIYNEMQPIIETPLEKLEKYEKENSIQSIMVSNIQDMEMDLLTKLLEKAMESIKAMEAALSAYIHTK